MVTNDALDHALRPLLPGLLSMAYVQRSGKAIVEMDSQASAEAAIGVLCSLRLPSIVYSPPGQTRTSSAALKRLRRPPLTVTLLSVGRMSTFSRIMRFISRAASAGLLA